MHPSLPLTLPKILSRRLSTSDVCDDRNTFPLLSLPLRLPNPLLRCEFPKSHRHRATWQPENSHGQPVPEALFDDDQDKQGTSEGEGKEKRLQRQRNMFATYSFLIPTPSTAVLGIKLPPSIPPPFLCSLERSLPSLFSGRPRFSSCHVTRRTRRTEGCGMGCVSSANCCGTGSESGFCARGKKW